MVTSKDLPFAHSRACVVDFHVYMEGFLFCYRQVILFLGDKRILSPHHFKEACTCDVDFY